MPQFSEPLLIQGLGEYIGELIIGAHIREINITTCHVLSYEMMPDLNMLGLVVLNRVVGNLDGTFVVAQERHLITRNSIILQGLPHPKKLCTTTRRGNILGLGGRKGDAILFLR
jgi:hypothetical protein